MDRTARLITNRPRRSRRASVIILAVAVLAVLAISAASYVTVTRLDRSSAAAYSRNTGFLQQRNAVVRHIESILAADLSGNKSVDSTIPRRDSAGRPIWPAPFEDGEYRDYPDAVVSSGATRYTFDERTTAQRRNNDAPAARSVLPFNQNLGPDGLYQIAFPDDAWLASTEPVNADPSAAGQEPDTWRQITNLRSEYRWSAERQQWERNDGRYVDLANFFLSEVAEDQRRGDPGADLTILEEEADDAVLNKDERFAGPLAMANQPVFHLQTAHMEDARKAGDYSDFDPDREAPDAIYENVDTRFWVDTDGDGRPDARWQELDILTGSKGLRWVAASRIQDASALVNVNVALDSGDPNDPVTIAAGITPADIDLRRLLETSSRSTSLTEMLHPDVVGLSEQDFNAHFNEHLLNGLRLGALNSPDNEDTKSTVFFELNERITDAPTDAREENPFLLWRDDEGRIENALWGPQDGAFEPPNQTARRFLRRNQREAHYRFVGSDFTRSPLRFRRGYDWKGNEYELRAFTGFNNPNGVSPLEQRLDGPADDNASRLPGAEPPYPESDSLGPLRSKEDPEQARTFADRASLPENSGVANTFTQQEKIERITKDPRRLLTTYNGSGFVSPQAGWFGRTDRDRLRLTNGALPEPLPLSASPQIIESWETEMIPFAQDAFGKFMWALAPFSTDRPPARAADGSGALVENTDSRAGYGGWQDGPTGVFEASNSTGSGPGGKGAPGGTGGPGGGGPAPTPSGVSGAVYPLRKAAAMTANLIDAMDREGVNGESPTPTVLRVHKTYDIFSARREGTTTIGDALAADATRDGVIEVGVDFPHGRLPIRAPDASNEDVLPEPFFSESTGFTVVGLDRQPFLRGAHAFSVYAALETTPVLSLGNIVPVDPNDTLAEVGAILAVEIGNPWPDPISLDEYSVLITNGPTTMTLNLSEIDPATGNSTLDPGDVAVIYYATEAPASGTLNFQTLWDEVRDAWVNNVTSQPAGEPLLLDMNGVEGRSSDPIFFKDFRGGDTPSVLLVRDMPTGTGRLLLDRLNPPPGGGNFPFTRNVSVDVDLASQSADGLDPMATNEVIAAFSDASFIARRTETTVGAGFPAYVIERPAQNAVVEFDAEGSATAVVRGSEDLMVDILSPAGSDPFTLVGAENDTMDDIVPSFQLFVPDGPLLSPTELLQLSIYAHVFQPSTGAGPSQPEVLPTFEWSGGQTRWTTVSEQLGSDIALAYDGASAPDPSNKNPFFGTLDFSRGIPGAPLARGGLSGWSGSAQVPNELRIPLALRVLDAFETLGSLGTLAQGRVNLNTAPDRVLSLLPLVDPRDPSSGYNSSTIAGWNGGARSVERLRYLMDYRAFTSPVLRSQRLGVGGTIDLDQDQEGLTSLTGLRAEPGGGVGAAGIVSLGELAIMHEWDATTGLPKTGGATAFAELGDDGPQSAPVAGNDSAALDIRESTVDAVSGADFDGDDDIEERLALARAVSAVSSNRSDVFIAWFVIRGYSPAAIEAIPVDPSMDEDERAELLNDLDPEHESRWLAVLDRSKVRQPTDRPEVVLLVELPSTSP